MSQARIVPQQVTGAKSEMSFDGRATGQHPSLKGVCSA